MRLRKILKIYKDDSNNLTVSDYLVKIYLGGGNIQNEKIITEYLKRNPKHFPYIWQLMGIYCSQSRFSDIKRVNKLILNSDVKNAYLRAVFSIPAMCKSESDVLKLRQSIDDILDKAIQNKHIPTRPDLLFKMTPFYLTYHQQSNRALFEKMVKVFSKGLIKVPRLKKTSLEKAKK